MRSPKGFTLIELILSVAMLAIVVSVTITTFLQFSQERLEIEIEQSMYENARFLMEKITKEIRENTIDYEEYWNRSMVDDDGFTWYGNRNTSLGDDDPSNNFYFCSRSLGASSPQQVALGSLNNGYQRHTYYQVPNTTEVMLIQPCVEQALSDGHDHQLYGQFAKLHWDYGEANDPLRPYTYTDDEELGTSFASLNTMPLSFVALPRWEDFDSVRVDWSLYDTSTSFNQTFKEHLAQRELYLFNEEDNTRRIYRLRPNTTCAILNTRDGSSSPVCPDATYQASALTFGEDAAQVASGTQWIPQYDGTLEKLELRGFDYGYDHDASVSTVDQDGSQYDGIVDTWVCDARYDCSNGDAVNDGVFFDGQTHYLPTTRDQGFQAVSSADISIKEIRFYISPIKDPSVAWGEDSPLVQNHPQVRVVLTVIPGYALRRKLYGPVPEVTLVTTVSSRLY